jgi:threonine/homoserine/homoserine lactone efflux protein
MPKGSKPAAMSGAFASGLLMNLLNPKVGVFYVSFLPQFVPAGADVAANTFLLVCMHGALSLVWFGILIAAATSLSRWLRRPAALITLDRLTGGVFVGFGVKLAASSAV